MAQLGESVLAVVRKGLLQVCIDDGFFGWEIVIKRPFGNVDRIRDLRTRRRQKVGPADDPDRADPLPVPADAAASSR